MWSGCSSRAEVSSILSLIMSVQWLRSIGATTYQMRCCRTKLGVVQSLQLHTTSIRSKFPTSSSSYEEIQIPVPWGHISGKWWGSKDIQPVVALHGFEDNAGTYDRLVPMLSVPAVFAWDAPGHGKSSHLPCGMVYNFIDFVIALRRIVKYFEWQKISIVGHSFGSAIGHIYSSMYPSEVDKLASLDCARTLMAMLADTGIKGLKRITEKSLKADNDFSKDPPAYTNADLVDAFCAGTLDSVSKEHAACILDRGIIPHPTKSNHYYFSRDQKLRYNEFNRPNIEILGASAENIRCHVMTILGSQGFINVAAESDAGKQYFKLEETIQKSAASYQRFVVEGTHHVHLNNPELVSPHLNKFFNN